MRKKAGEAGRKFAEFVELVRFLRSARGCPWDRKQTNSSLKPDLIEEAYEVAEAIDERNPAKLREELGDLLHQVLFQAQIASERGRFDILQVLSENLEKMKKRHSHVFDGSEVLSPDEIYRRWHDKKHAERNKKRRTSVIDGIPKDLPALRKAHNVGRKVARVGFDWDTADDCMKKVNEELRELKKEMRSENRRAAGEEMGDLLFTVANLARKMDFHAEDLLERTLRKFKRRFQAIEKKIAGSGRKFSDYSISELNGFWNAAKRKPRKMQGRGR